MKKEEQDFIVESMTMGQLGISSNGPDTSDNGNGNGSSKVNDDDDSFDHEN